LQNDLESGDNFSCTPYVLGTTLKNDFPEIEKFARLTSSGSVFIKKDNEFIKEDLLYTADPELFDILTIPFLMGNPETVLLAPNSIVISEKIAKKYFGNQNPIGEVLTISSGGVESFKITGVLKETNFRSHFEPNLIIPMHHNKMQRSEEDWGTNNPLTYILLPDNYDASELEAKLEDFAKRHLPEYIKRKYYLQSVGDIYLYSEDLLWDEHTKRGNINYVYSYSCIAILILLIACINYILLSTAHSTIRAKEIGIRKVVGACRSDLTNQMLSESLCISFISLPIALVLVELFLPHLNQLLGLNLSTNFLSNWKIILGFLLITIIVGILSGSYIAFYASSFQPIQILRNRLQIGKPKSNLRRGLIIVQVVIFIILIFCSLNISKQMQYILSKDLGFNKEQILIIPRLWTEDFQRDIESFRSELLRNPDIVNISFTSYAPPRLGNNEVADISTANKKIDADVIRTDHNFLNTLEIDLLEGRNFSLKFPSDCTDAAILNQAAVKQLEIDNPIGQNIKFWWKDQKIIGIINDTYFHSLYEEKTPTIIICNIWAYKVILVRILNGDIGKTVNFIERKWYEFFPSFPFDYSFMDEKFDQAYKADMCLGKLIGYFAFLAIFVACIGQFGLVLFTTERRTKEIGIRKVLGASIPNIVIMLIKEFIILIIAASVIAYPFAHYIIKIWLQNFAYRIDIGLGTFFLSVIIALIITLITVGSQAVRAARANPIDSLRYE
jgi:putative ABC transport system permease protein